MHVPKPKKKPTYRYYRAEFTGTMLPRWEALEQYRRRKNWPENGAWVSENGSVLRRVTDREAYEAIWAVPIERTANATK
jgi:hypothetical protein